MYGLPWGMTAYGGALLSADYNALALGTGKNFGTIGAVSVDVTQAKSQLRNNEKEEGQSYRFLYSKSFEGGTDLRLLGYKYSTSGYYTSQKQLMFAVTPTVITAVITSAARYRAILPSNWETTARFISI